MKPRHIAISLERNIATWAEKNSKSREEAYECRTLIVEELIESQVRLNIPVMTIFLLRQEENNPEIIQAIESISGMFDKLAKNPLIRENQVRISVFGKWYDLTGRCVDTIKAVLEDTETYDKFFLNFCIYYDGREELVDACRLIAMKVKSDKIDPDAISSELIKESLYTSYFLAPDLVVINGEKTLNSLMLWDISEARIYFTGKDWPDFNAFELKKAIDLYKLVGSAKR